VGRILLLAFIAAFCAQAEPAGSAAVAEKSQQSRPKPAAAPRPLKWIRRLCGAEVNFAEKVSSLGMREAPGDGRRGRDHAEPAGKGDPK
jgi:hypothetical protein